MVKASSGFKASSGESRALRREADRKRMAEAIEALQTSEGWQRWLRVRAAFRSYSFQNQLLIAHQCPQATRVAGFRKWLGLGYAVRKGEHAIRIWAPCPPSKRQIERWRQAGADPNAEPRTFYKMVPVFDHSQVEPLPEFSGGPVELEPPHEPLEGDSCAELFEPLVGLAGSIGVEVASEQLSGPAAGYFDQAAKRIVIDDSPEHSPNARVATLIHETSHALVRLERGKDDPKLEYASEEVIVEAVAFTVCASVGFDSSAESVPYVAGWGQGEAADSVERYAELIDRLARRIEEFLASSIGGRETR